MNKDFINISDGNFNKISTLKEFSNMLLKLCGKIDESMMIDNVEWILYKIFTIIEDHISSSNVDKKNEKEYPMLKQIYEDLTQLNIKNNSFMLSNLFDIVLKKIADM